MTRKKTRSTTAKSKPPEGAGLTFLARRILSVSHLQSAVALAARARRLEQRTTEHAQQLHQRRIEHRAVVVGSILATGGFLDATINELFEMTADPAEDPLRTDGAPFDGSRRLYRYFHQLYVRSVWRLEEVQRLPLLAKYELALSMSDATEPSAPAWVLVHDFLALRNTLVHYAPHWVTVISPGGHARDPFEARLGTKFSPNALAGWDPPRADLPTPFMPDRCLGYGCARWSVTTALAFTDWFHAAIKNEPRYRQLQEDGDLDPDRWG